jgi:hypothetical protein
VELYEKHVSENGRIRYILHEKKGAGIVELDNVILATMISTFVVGMIEATQVQLATHSRHGRQLRKLQDALVDYAKLTAIPLEDAQVDAVCHAWNAGMQELQVRLQ